MEEKKNKELLRLIAGGQEEAFTALYEETRIDIFTFALSILNNYHDAEDVMQEVFVKIKLQACTCNDFKNANGWLMRITRNTALDCIRKKRRCLIDEEIAKRSSTSAVENSVSEHFLFMNELFNELKPDERQIVVLHLVSDLTHRTIAKTLNLPLTTVKWRYRKAILHLEKISKRKEWEL